MEKDWTPEMQEKLVKAVADRLFEWFFQSDFESVESCLKMAKRILRDTYYLEIDGYQLAKNLEDEFVNFADQELVLLLSDVVEVAEWILQNT